LVVINIDRKRGRATPMPPADDDDVIELIEPGPVATDGNMSSGGSTADLAGAGGIVLDDGAWVRITDPETQRLKQQYRWHRQNPNPSGKGPGWIEMTRPEARLYLSDDRIATLEADSALAYVPGHSGLQSGEMNGNVVIRLFERLADGSISLDPRDATLQVLASQATFDDFTGEIACDGHVEISTPTSEFTGEGLQIRLNDQDRDVRISVSVDRDNVVRLSRAASASAQPKLHSEQADPAAAAGRASHGKARGNASRSEAPVELKDETPARSDRAPAEAARDGDSKDSAPVQYYRLTMHNGVEVQDGSGDTGRIIAGESLHMYFSTQSQGFDGTAISIGNSSYPQGQAAQREHLTTNALVAALATAAVQDETPRHRSLAPPPSPDDIVITCEDQLTIEAIDPIAADLPTPQDARLEIVGHPVHVFDAATQATVSCGRLSYRTSGELLEMHATSLVPLRFNSPEMSGEGSRFWIVREGQAAGFTGAGWLEFGEAKRSSHLPPASLLSCVMWLDPISAIDGTSGSHPRGDRVRVEWSEAVELEFFERAAAESQGGIQSATFLENVIILGDEFAMAADSIAVRFSPPPDPAPGDRKPQDAWTTDGQFIDRIQADGRVVILGLNDAGYITCANLILELSARNGHPPAPDALRASGDVQVSDPRQTLWADDLTATFMNIERRGDSTGNSTASRFGNADVHLVTARGRVEVLFGDGGRAFGDQLLADAAAQTAELTGSHVIVAQDNLFVERGTRIELDQRTGSARFNGGGALMQFDQPLSTSFLPEPLIGARLQALANRARQNPPVIARRTSALPVGSGRATMTTTWRDFAVFSGNANDGGGRAEFHGQVRAFAERTPLERNSVLADDLELDFLKTDSNGAANAATSDLMVSDAGSISGESRALRRFLAKGGASVEYQSWVNEDHSDSPRIFAIHGEVISYDNERGEALVDGPGRLVVQDLRGKAGENANNAGPFSNQGISRFLWSHSLRMTRQADDTSLIVLDGDVSLEHLSRASEISTLSADRVEVTVHGNQSPLERSSLGLAGDAALSELSAIGSVFIRTNDREIDCSRLDYDEPSHLATILGKESKLALVRQRGTTNALRMLEGRWNVQTNAVTIIKGAAGGGR
jgi:lipopolysaccharide export system protein LptA